MKTDTEVLREALGIIERPDGWCKRALRIWNGAEATYCLEGAIAQAAEAEWIFDVLFRFGTIPAEQDLVAKQLRRLNELVLEHSGYPVRTWMRGAASTQLSEFNDDENTTQEDAILALKRALAEAEGSS